MAEARRGTIAAPAATTARALLTDARAGTGGVDEAPREATSNLVEVPGDRGTRREIFCRRSHVRFSQQDRVVLRPKARILSTARSWLGALDASSQIIVPC